MTVSGTVYVVAGTYNSGTHYIPRRQWRHQPSSRPAAGLVLGDVVEVTGTVSAFSRRDPDRHPSISLHCPGPRGRAHAHHPGDAAGRLRERRQLRQRPSAPVAIPVGRPGNIFLYDGTDTLQVYIDSDTGIDLGAVQVGDLYQVSSPVVNYNGLIELKPRRQSRSGREPRWRHRARDRQRQLRRLGAAGQPGHRGHGQHHRRQRGRLGHPVLPGQRPERLRHRLLDLRGHEQHRRQRLPGRHPGPAQHGRGPVLRVGHRRRRADRDQPRQRPDQLLHHGRGHHQHLQDAVRAPGHLEPDQPLPGQVPERPGHRHGGTGPGRRASAAWSSRSRIRRRR